MVNPKAPTHQEVQKSLNRLEDKVDDRLGRMEGKIDATGLAIKNIGETMVANTRTLEEHVRRTNLLEDRQNTDKVETDKRLKLLEETHEVIKGLPDKLYKVAKWITTISALISLAAGIAHLAIRFLMG